MYAVTRTYLDASRYVKSTTELPCEEDLAGNIMSNSTTATTIFGYNTAEIPAFRLENLLKLITVPEQVHQALLLFHQQTQGSNYKMTS